jgi:hypothetical protein
LMKNQLSLSNDFYSGKNAGLDFYSGKNIKQ